MYAILEKKLVYWRGMEQPRLACRCRKCRTHAKILRLLLARKISPSAIASRIGVNSATVRSLAKVNVIRHLAGKAGREAPNLIGRRFGRWKVLRYVGRGCWRCRCDCGTIRVHTTGRLRRARQCLDCMAKEVKIHGHSHPVASKTYRAWGMMLQYCLNRKNKAYSLYGGRKPPIRVCRRWRKFANFLTDMGDKPIGTKLTIKDRRCGFRPGNAVWKKRRS